MSAMDDAYDFLQRVPSDVWMCIFDRCKSCKATLHSLSTVCRLFHALTQSARFRRLVLIPSNVLKLQTNKSVTSFVPRLIFADLQWPFTWLTDSAFSPMKKCVGECGKTQNWLQLPEPIMRTVEIVSQMGSLCSVAFSQSSIYPEVLVALSQLPNLSELSFTKLFLSLGFENGCPDGLRIRANKVAIHSVVFAGGVDTFNTFLSIIITSSLRDLKLSCGVQRILSMLPQFSAQSLTNIKIIPCDASWDVVVQMLASQSRLRYLNIIADQPPLIDLPETALPNLNVIKGPAAVLNAVAAGRPIHNVLVYGFLLPNTFRTLSRTTVPLRRLVFEAPSLTDLLFRELTDCLPYLEDLTILVASSFEQDFIEHAIDKHLASLPRMTYLRLHWMLYEDERRWRSMFNEITLEEARWQHDRVLAWEKCCPVLCWVSILGLNWDRLDAREWVGRLEKVGTWFADWRSERGRGHDVDLDTRFSFGVASVTDNELPTKSASGDSL